MKKNPIFQIIFFITVISVLSACSRASLDEARDNTGEAVMAPARDTIIAGKDAELTTLKYELSRLEAYLAAIDEQSADYAETISQIEKTKAEIKELEIARERFE